MNDLRWFRLLLFCIGVYFAGTGVISFLNLLRWVFGEVMGGYTISHDGIATFLVKVFVYFIPCIFTLSLGAYLMRGGGAFTKWIIRRIESNCMRCDTDLRGLTSNRCPGCGLEFERLKAEGAAPEAPRVSSL